MVTKLVFEYATYGPGFTETWYKNTDDFVSAAPLVQQELNRIMAPRAFTTRLIAVRSSLVGSPFLSYEWRPTPNLIVTGARLAGGGIIPSLENEDLVNTCAQVRLTTIGGRRSRHDLAGLLDTDVVLQANGSSTPSPGLGTALIQWVQQFIVPFVATYGTYSQVRPTPANQVAAITHIIPHQGNPYWTDLTLASSPTGLAVNQVVQIRGINQNDLAQLKGQFVILAINAGPPPVVTIAYRFRNTSSDYQPAKGNLRIVTNVFDPFNRYQFIRFSTHKRGRPIERSVGRRRPTTRRQ